MTEITFSCPLPPRGLRRNSLMRHFAGRARLTREYQELVWCEANLWHAPHWTVMTEAATKGIPWEKAHVHYVWYSTHETDADNIISSMKACLDVIKSTGPRPLGIIKDDGPGVQVTAEWQKARTRKEQRVEVTISRG